MENQLDHLPRTAAGFAAPADETPFTFADPDHIRRTVSAAGFGKVEIAPRDARVSSGDLDAMTQVLLKMEALGKIVRVNPALRPRVEPRLRAALAALGDPADVGLRAAVWIVQARADTPPQ